ncbi:MULTISPECIES: substrate-binding domain-containing protein [unclassified Actinomyces]|uniref:substrate-binding domain-containing protein n=1 Tax=unclassified Actinomyces TaxID=2609248 RepID=UPI00235168A2|nr:substrate-binding domain-containing protein [Actinomyces sp. 432]
MHRRGPLAGGLVLANPRPVLRAGQRVPEDVSVVGFDGLDLARYADPPLTTRQPIRDKATTAVAFLLDELGDGDGAPRQTVLPVAWQEGRTLGPAPS